jgi:adenylate cyclase
MQTPSLILANGGEERRFKLEENSCRIGRDAQNTVVLDGDNVSRNHAMVQRTDSGGFLLFDLGSRNGTVLNGRRVAAPGELHHGDVIQIGNFTLQFSDPASDVESSNRRASETILDLATSSMVVLVADIRNFSGLSVELGETRVAELMSAFNGTTGAILNHAGAWTQKYIGDAVMAVWLVAPGRNPASLLQAAFSTVLLIKAAVQEISEHSGLNAPVQLGFGINVGLASIGNLGSVGAADHTALGEAVNMAFRLEASTRILGCELAVGEDVCSALRSVMRIDGIGTKHRLILKGYPSEVNVYSMAVEDVEQIRKSLEEAFLSATQPSGFPLRKAP